MYMFYMTFNSYQFLINDLHNISIMYMYNQSSVIDRKKNSFETIKLIFHNVKVRKKSNLTIVTLI